jgi:hypothetical protein
MVAVIVVSARRAPCHAGDAAGRQRPSYDGVRLVCGYGETGSLRRVGGEYKSGGDRSLKQTAAMWPPRVTVKQGWNS